MAFFSDFQYGFRCSRSSSNLLAVVTNRIARAFIGLVLLELQHLIYPRVLTGFGMPVFFTNLNLMVFQLRYLVLFCFSSVIDNFQWFWMKTVCNNIQLILEFPKAPFLVLHFSYYTLMTFLTVLSITLLSMLMMLLTTLSVIRHLICGKNQEYFLSLNLIFETLRIGQDVARSFRCQKDSAGFA